MTKKTTTTGLEPVRECRSRFLVYLLNRSDKLPPHPTWDLNPEPQDFDVALLRSLALYPIEPAGPSKPMCSSS